MNASKVLSAKTYTHKKNKNFVKNFGFTPKKYNNNMIDFLIRFEIHMGTICVGQTNKQTNNGYIKSTIKRYRMFVVIYIKHINAGKISSAGS